MNKKNALTLAVGMALGGLGVQLAQPAHAELPPPVTQLINFRGQREVLPDGGTQWAILACGYEMPRDGGTQHVAEPCWEKHVVMPGLEQALKRD